MSKIENERKGQIQRGRERKGRRMGETEGEGFTAHSYVILKY